MSITDYSKRTIIELENNLREKREIFRKFKFDITGSRAKNVKEGKTLRKDIARILTFINQKRSV
jgi:ribosomal protein L29